MTTPTGIVARLLAMAEDHERKGAALRLAAEELHGRKVEAKRNGFDKTIASAIELRESERPDPQAGQYADNRPRARGSLQQRDQLILSYFSAHPEPQRVEAIRTMLASYGHELSHDGVRNAMVRVGCVVTNRRWQLAGASDGAPAIAGILARSPQKTRRRRSYTERKAASRDKAEKLAIILREAGKPLLTKDLAEAAQQVGVTSLTGIYGYVRKGWLSRTGKHKGNFRYAFRQLPSADV